MLRILLSTFRSKITPLFSIPVLFLIVGAGFAAEAPQATHYRLQINIVPGEERMSGTAQITLANTTDKDLREIHFLLYRLLTVDGAENERGAPLSYRPKVVSVSDEKNWQVNSASVRLRKRLRRGDTTRITLKYSGAIFGYREVMGYVRDHIGEDYSLLRQDALAYPVLAEPSFASMVATSDTKFDYEMEVTVPRGMIVACGGVLRGTSTNGTTETFRFVSAEPTWRIDIAAAKFKMLKNSAGNLGGLCSRGRCIPGAHSPRGDGARNGVLHRPIRAFRESEVIHRDRDSGGLRLAGGEWIHYATGECTEGSRWNGTDLPRNWTCVECKGQA